MFAFIEKYIIYILIVIIILIGIFAGYQMLKNSTLKNEIVKLQSDNRLLTDNNKALTAQINSCKLNLDNIKILNTKVNIIKTTKDTIDNRINNYKPKPKDSIDNRINNYKPNGTVVSNQVVSPTTIVSTTEKGDKPNEEDELVNITNTIISNFNKSGL